MTSFRRKCEPQTCGSPGRKEKKNISEENIFTLSCHCSAPTAVLLFCVESVMVLVTGLQQVNRCIQPSSFIFFCVCVSNSDVEKEGGLLK